MGAVTFPVITLWQPWASLCVEPFGECISNHPLDIECVCPMIKRYETRGHRAPSTIIGKRVWIHAAAKPFGVNSIQAEAVRGFPPEVYNYLADGTTFDIEESRAWPLGALVGSAVIGEPLPIEGLGDHHPFPPDWSLECGEVVYLFPQEDELRIVNRFESPPPEIDITDQIPYGDWAPGRWAWPLLDPVRIDEQIPMKGAQGVWYTDVPPVEPTNYQTVTSDE
jgi:hypothetical protein